MSDLTDIIKRNNLWFDERTLSEIYGTEYFGLLLYSLVRMERPNNIIEIGSGFGCASTLLGQALKENKKGKLWSIDNQKDWPYIKKQLEKIKEKHDTYEDYFNYLLNKFELQNYVFYQNINFDFKNQNTFFNINDPVDILFSDASDSGRNGCIKILSFYLSKMSEYSSIFIDRASTLNNSFLTLEYIVNCFKKGQVPKILLEEKTEKEIDYLFKFIRKSKFTLIHLAESPEMKFVEHQNSTAWLKIEPLDIIIGNGVINYMND